MRQFSTLGSARLPTAAHTSRQWRIHDVVRDFHLEDVWALPTPGAAGDFPRLVHALPAMLAGAGRQSRVLRALFGVRWALGRLLGLDRPDTGLDTRVASLRERLPADLRYASTETVLPRFATLYLLDDEWAAEIANRTVQGVIHVGWVPAERGRYRGEMAVYAKPNGRLGKAYMAAITPFRRLLVYPVMLRQLERAWRETIRQESRAPRAT